MDDDRIKGALDQAKGAIKEGAGKLTGDTKLEAEGKADKAAGKVREHRRRREGHGPGRADKS